jgi:hypothetical protein
MSAHQGADVLEGRKVVEGTQVVEGQTSVGDGGRVWGRKDRQGMQAAVGVGGCQAFSAVAGCARNPPFK